MVTHMNSDQRSKWLSVKSKGDKLFCRGCGKEVFKDKEPKALVDHIDNDSSHNISKNIQILCRSCNRIKNPSKTFQPPKVLTQSEATNLRVEDAWREWITNKCAFAPEGIEVDEAISSGSELFKISPETIERRYLKKITNIWSGKLIWDKKHDLLFSREYWQKLKDRT